VPRNQFLEGGTRNQAERIPSQYLGVFLNEEKDSIWVEDPAFKSISFVFQRIFWRQDFLERCLQNFFGRRRGSDRRDCADLHPIRGRGGAWSRRGLPFIPKSLTAKMNEISEALVEYKQLKILKKPIKSSYMMALLMVTLLILFSATWFGFYLAKEMTIPIKELAEATHRIASGDLNYRIKMNAADEIGTWFIPSIR